MSRKNPHWGTTLDTFLAEDGILQTTKDEALTRIRTTNHPDRLRAELMEMVQDQSHLGLKDEAS